MLDILKFSLEALGFKNIICAYDGNRGHQIFLKERPDIIITGWETEGISGLDLTKLIRSNKQLKNRQVPIVFLTGHSSESRVKQALSTGINAYVIKPFTAKRLSSTIESLINNPRDFIETPDYFGPNFGFITENGVQIDTNNNDKKQQMAEQHA